MGVSLELGSPDESIRFEALLQTLDRPVPCQIRRPDAPEIEPATTALVPRDHWPHHPAARTSITCHVDPTDPALGRFWSGAAPHSDLLSDFRRCADILASGYRLPHRLRLSNGATAQRVPTPTEIAQGQDGTCLDFSLLLAALHESSGGAPILVFSGGCEDRPDHAMVAAWTAPDSEASTPGTPSTPGNPKILNTPKTSGSDEEVIEADALREWIRAGRIRILESTELARDKSRDPVRAEEIARHFVETVACHGVDVRAVRRGAAGRAAPGALLYSPIVARADLLASGMAAAEGGGQRETLHILRAMARMRSPVLVELADEKALLRLGRDGVRESPSKAELKTTQGYQTTFVEARLLASRRPNRVVTEADLLQALLRRPRPAIRRSLEEAGLDPGRMIQGLEASQAASDPVSDSGWDTTHG